MEGKNSNKINPSKNDIDKSAKGQLLKYSKHFTPTTRLHEIIQTRAIDIEKDIYGNEIVSLFNFKSDKESSKFNLLKCFKPGEILSFIVSN